MDRLAEEWGRKLLVLVAGLALLLGLFQLNAASVFADSTSTSCNNDVCVTETCIEDPSTGEESCSASTSTGDSSSSVGDDEDDEDDSSSNGSSSTSCNNGVCVSDDDPNNTSTST
jgi:hypothetical protein